MAQYHTGFILRAPVSAPQAPENWALALSWTSDHRHITGFIVGAKDEDREWLERNLQAGAQSFHALSIPLLLIESVLRRDAKDLRRYGQDLLDIERKTRLYDWSASAASDSSSDVDFDDFTKKLNGVINRLAFQEMRLQELKGTFDRISKCSQKMKMKKTIDLSELNSVLNQLREETKSLSQIVAYHQRVAQSLIGIVRPMT